MSDNQPPPYPGDPSGQQPQPEQPGPSQPAGQGQPWGAAPPPPQQPYQAAPGQWSVRPKHPQATLVLVLGILGLVVCQVLGPFAWVMGNKAVAEIDANPGAYEGRGEAQAGRILGIISTVILVLSIVAIAFFAVLVIAGIASASSEMSDVSELSLVSWLG